MEITKNQRTHIVVLSDGREINITRDQYVTLKLKLDDPGSRFSDLLHITDADTNETLFDGKVGAIKEFKERKQEAFDRAWVCSYGDRHSINGFPDNCECKKKFKCEPYSFLPKLQELGFKVNYDSDITKEMRDAYMAKQN